MSLRFVYGPAGAGKSTFIHEEMVGKAEKEPSRSFILIVPDQFTIETQADIVKAHPKGGILNIDVLSFERLCYRVFSEAGEPETPILDDTGKSLVIRRVAGSVSEKMPYIGANLCRTGYIHEVKSQISEFMQYGVSVKDVEKLAATCTGLLKSKLSDLSVIYGAFMDFNREKFITGEEKLDILCRKMQGADFLKDAFIVFDGFTGFTPIQNRVILKLLELGCELTVTLTLSAPEDLNTPGHEEKLFYMSRSACLKLKTGAKDLGVTVEPDVRIDGENTGRFRDNAELAHLEANLFRYPCRQYDGVPEDIRITACDSIQSEVSDVALKISELVREKGLEYRDIGVIVGDPDAYASVFETRMREAGIPFFIDRTASILLNPFTEYLKSALKIVINDYSYDSVFHYLKSGFTRFSRQETDRFDRYVRSLNIRGRAYRKPFTRLEKGMRDKENAERLLPEMERMRSEFMEELSVLESPAKTAGDHVRNLYRFLKNNDSFERLDRLREKYEEAGDQVKAGEYGQIYRLIMELLDMIDSIIGEEIMDREEFYRIFEAGIAEIKVGNVPGSIDRVVIGNIERTRLNRVKALFFVGVNDGNIPKASDKAGFLSAAEKEKLESAGYELSPTPREAMYTQRLYLYMNLLKPDRYLFLSYALTDTSGKAMFPSYLINVLTGIFPGLKVGNVSSEADEARLINPGDSLRYFAGLLRGYAEGTLTEHERSLTRALLEIYREIGEKKAGDITEAAFVRYVPEALSREMVRLLYTDVIKASVSRMETYAECAYSYFLRYGMQLKEDEDSDFKSVDLGNIYHGVLDGFAGLLEKTGRSWADLAPEEAHRLVKQAVKEYCETYEQGMMGDDARNAYMVERITRMMIRTVDTLQYQLSFGRFRVSGHEYPFKREIGLEDGKLLLNGKVDRIDICEEDGRIYVKVIDYKSGGHKLDLTEVYHGISEQLVVYMKEALAKVSKDNPGKEVVPAALFYYLIDNPMIDSAELKDGKTPEEEILKELRPSGMMESSDANLNNLAGEFTGSSPVIPIKRNKDGKPDAGSAVRLATGEEILHMTGFTEELIKRMAGEIIAGNKAVSPLVKDDDHSPCTYCSFKGICRFDEHFPGYEAREMTDKTPEEIRQIVMGT